MRYKPQQLEGKASKGGGNSNIILCRKEHENLSKYYGRMTNLIPPNLRVTLSHHQHIQLLLSNVVVAGLFLPIKQNPLIFNHIIHYLH